MFARYRYPSPLTRGFGSSPPHFPSSKSSILHIIAKIAKFQLTEQHSHLLNSHTLRKTPCGDDVHELCYLAITNDQNHTAGTRIAGGDMLQQLVNKTHRFLAIARLTASRFEDDVCWDAQRKRFIFWTEQSPEAQEQSAILQKDVCSPSLN